MKILSCVPYEYYGDIGTETYEYLSFVEIPRQMAHTVHHFDYERQHAVNADAMNEFFLATVRGGGYDLVIIQTNADQFYPETLLETRKHVLLLAWNCDDDWRWDDYSSKWAEYYSRAATTYRHIYEANVKAHPNLVLSQWGCTGLDDGLNTTKDLEISFVGRRYWKRTPYLKLLAKKLPFTAFGKGVLAPRSLGDKIRIRLARLSGIPWNFADKQLKTQSQVKAVWNRSKISFTPLEGTFEGSLQIKGRVFDMGLSGTLMLCDRNEALYEFYEPGKEFIEFESPEDCVEKARYYLKHETERKKIAEAYYRRTKVEHLWTHRYERLFKEIGLKA